jgi:succinate dehydrogenase / fumarate reductase cytochrome b subunit
LAAPSTPIGNTIKGYATYKGREGHYAFLLHRLTGLGTLLFLTIHILDTSTVYFWPELYEHAIALYRHPLFMMGEIALVFSLVYHGVNGLRIAATDLWLPAKWGIKIQRNAVRYTLLISLVLWAPAGAWMFYSMVRHSFPDILNQVLALLGLGG